MMHDATRRSAPPLFSVVVPTYNAGLYLGAALQSIRAQAVQDLEVIVVDDGSEHSVEHIVRSILPDAVFLRQTNRGPSAARNVALRHATGRLIAFLDADDLWVETTLSRLLKGFADAPSVSVVQGSIKRFSETQATGTPVALGPAYFSFNLGALAVRRVVLERTGLFDETLRQSEDVDLHIRLKECRATKLVLPDTVLYYRLHAASLNARECPPILTEGHQGNWLRLLKDSLERRRKHSAVREGERLDRDPEITVALVVRNGRRFLPSALASLRRQSLKPSEILAVVGPSDDGTSEYLERQADVRLVMEDGDGLGAARNQAIEHARYDTIAFLDCDDLWHRDKLRQQIAALSVLEEPGYSVTSVVRLPDSPDFSDRMPRVAADSIRVGLTPSALVAKRAVFQALRGFDPDLGSGCDADWFFRARKLDIPCSVASQILVFKRIHDHNLSRSAAGNRRDMFEIIRKNRGA